MRRIWFRTLSGLSLLLIAGCNNQPDTVMDIKTNSLEGRFQISRVGVFRDGLAYGNERAIYILVDTQTKREYVGISGIGISEVGNHTAGKNKTVEDER